MEITRQQKIEFLEVLWQYYAQAGRDSLPWRQPEGTGEFSPYKIMVSELMLQQTQVSRVISKYTAFLERFPTVESLAVTELGDVLILWQGLGYNRRAKFLWQAARQVVELQEFPRTAEALIGLPGVGVNTAGAILAYAYNLPTVFIETNVRTVYIHHFFDGHMTVSDKEIATVVAQTLESENPREFYWALMDYGSYLKSAVGNLNTVSKHYSKQSRFDGSRRQIRGHIIKLLGSAPHTTEEISVVIDDERLATVLIELVEEGMIRILDNGAYSL
jgi:A/G-specific adenine glycosylase